MRIHLVRLQVICLSLHQKWFSQSGSLEGLLAATGVVLDVITVKSVHGKDLSQINKQWRLVEEGSVDTVIVISELESISSFKERVTLQAFLDGKDISARCLIQSPAKCFLKVPALFQTVSKDDSLDGSV